MFAKFLNLLRKNQIFMLVVVQVAIFGICALIAYLTGFAYNIVLVVAGVTIMLLLLPFNSELQSYGSSANIMMHHAHHQALNQMSESQTRWHDNLINVLYGLIPFVAGIVIAFL